VAQKVTAVSDITTRRLPGFAPSYEGLVLVRILKKGEAGMTSVVEQNSYATNSIASGDEVRALNGLIVSVLDNVDECRRAVFALEQQVAALQHRLHNRMQAVEQLQARVRELGGEPAATHSVLAAALANLLTVHQPYTRNRKEDLLQDVERGEQSLKVQFNHCLTTKPLSPVSRECVSSALHCVLSERNRKADGWSPQGIITAPNPLPPSLSASIQAFG
jgi:uncharacterized protein (TIGR02284 family)